MLPIGGRIRLGGDRKRGEEFDPIFDHPDDEPGTSPALTEPRESS